MFNAKPVIDYHLSRSFRFGPFIAQCAANLIANNATRLEKPLIAYQSGKAGFIQLFQGDNDSARELTDEIQAMLELDGIPPSQISVMARMYAQLDSLEAEFLSRHIPYRVEGQEPFFKRQEIKVLLDYLRLGRDFEEPLTEQRCGWLLNIANNPSRMLSRSLLNKTVEKARYRRLTVRQALDDALQYRYLICQDEGKLFKCSYHQHILEGGDRIRVSVHKVVESASMNTDLLASFHYGHAIIGVLDNLERLVGADLLLDRGHTGILA